MGNLAAVAGQDARPPTSACCVASDLDPAIGASSRRSVALRRSVQEELHVMRLAPGLQLGLEHRPQRLRPRRRALRPGVLGGREHGRHAHREVQHERTTRAGADQFFFPARLELEGAHGRLIGAILDQ